MLLRFVTAGLLGEVLSILDAKEWLQGPVGRSLVLLTIFRSPLRALVLRRKKLRDLLRHLFVLRSEKLYLPQTGFFYFVDFGDLLLLNVEEPQELAIVRSQFRPLLKENLRIRGTPLNLTLLIFLISSK